MLTTFLKGTPARGHRMAIEISVITVGAVFLVVLLLMVLLCMSGQREKTVQENLKGSKSTGNYLFLVFIFIFEHSGCTINNFVKYC